MKALMIMALASALGVGCDNTSAGLKADANQALSTAVHHARAAGEELSEAKRDFKSDLRSFTTKTTSELETLAAKIDRLQRESVNAPANAKQALSEQAASLEARKEALQAKTNALGNRVEEEWSEAKEEWSEAKTELANDVASLGRDIDKALDELGNNVRRATN